MARRITKAQMSALRWLDGNGGLEVPNMNMDGKAREWPQRRTLNALIARGLIDFKQSTYAWRVDVNAAGATEIARSATPMCPKAVGSQIG